MDLGLEGRVAAVTGASRGIGREVALALAAAGAHVAAVATTEAGAQATAELCAEKGVTARGYALDVSDFAAAQDWGRKVIEDFGQIDVLVNNAGVTRDGLVFRMGEEDWDRVIDVNLKGAFNTVRALARPILKRRGARIINLASVIGMSGNAGQANYAASKGGLIALTRSLAKEFGGRGVCVNAIAPGLIETDMTRDLPEAARAVMMESIALGRIGTPADVAGAVLFLASKLSDYVTGQVLVVDGGMRR